MENDSAKDTGSSYAPSDDDIHMLSSDIEIHQQPTLTSPELLNPKNYRYQLWFENTDSYK